MYARGLSGVGFRRTRGYNTAMSIYTDGRYGQRNLSWHEEDAADKAQGIADLLWISGLRPSSIVDVGCGTGRVLFDLKAILDKRDLTEISYEGWDIATDAIERASKREGEHLKFVAADFLVSKQSADLVLCIDTFEHVDDDVAFLKSLADRAERFVFRIPLDLSVLDVLRPKRLIAARREWGHRHVYTRTLALEVLREAGYRVLAERYHRINRPTAGLDPLRFGLYRLRPHLAVSLLGGFSLLILASRQGSSSPSAAP